MELNREMRDRKARILYFNICSVIEHGINSHGGGEYSKTILARLCASYSDKATIRVIKSRKMDIDVWLKKLIEKKDIYIIDIDDETEISNILSGGKLESDQIVYFDGNIKESANKFRYVEGITYIGTFHGPRLMELIPQKTDYLYSDSILFKIKAVIKYIFRRQYHRLKKARFKAIYDRFDYLIGDSEHALYSMRSLYPNRYDSRLMIYYAPAKHTECDETDSRLQKTGTNNKYILLISGNRSEKNIHMGITACDELFSSNYLWEYKVIVTGNVSNSIRRKIKNSKRFEFLDYVSTKELELLYMNSDLFLYPTLNEGFGYPPIEAMKYYKTCIVSAVCSLSEIYGNSVYYVNPYDLNEIKTRILYAAINKIDKHIISRTYKRIKRRQEEDLIKLCELLISS